MEFIFIDPNWNTENGKYCSPRGAFYDTLERAKEQCIRDDTCVKVLDIMCDNSSPFYLCHDGSREVNDADGLYDGKPDCMYTKPGNKVTFYRTL